MVPDKSLCWPIAFALPWGFSLIRSAETNCGFSGLCQRRRWPDPAYNVSYSPSGYRCIVRVNNREYQTSSYHSSESSAKEGAALIAFNICRNFSANDGMYPTGFAHGGVIQGNPVPVGSGRHARRSDTRSDYRYGDTDSSGSRSGGSSPDWRESRQPTQMSASYRSSYSSSSSDSSHYSRRGTQRH
jgi:hypothetical protein